MKEAWRSVVRRVRAGCEVVVVARPEIQGARVNDVTADLEGLLNAAGVMA